MKSLNIILLLAIICTIYPISDGRSVELSDDSGINESNTDGPNSDELGHDGLDTEAPGGDALDTEAQGTEASETEASGTEELETIVPGTEASDIEESGTDGPGTEASETEASGLEELETVLPGTEASDTEAPSTESVDCTCGNVSGKICGDRSDMKVSPGSGFKYLTGDCTPGVLYQCNGKFTLALIHSFCSESMCLQVGMGKDYCSTT